MATKKPYSDYPDDARAISEAVEALLVSRNPRGMARVGKALAPGYYLRAATTLASVKGTVLIGTGFPVNDTYETDGPAGALALYDCLQKLGAQPVIVCGSPLAQRLAEGFRVHDIAVGNRSGRLSGQEHASVRLRDGRREGDPEISSRRALESFAPTAVISIERPGLNADGRYTNMRGEDITDRCACFDYFIEFADCPTIGIGDGGNEIGMGNVQEAVADLSIIPSVTRCDELLVADVSNWGAYGLIAMLGYISGQDLLGSLSPRDYLEFLKLRGSVDGVTRENTATEDGFDAEVGEAVVAALREITGYGESE